MQALILVDDGSTDRSAEVATRFLERNPGGRLFRHPRNLGMAEAIRTALTAVVLGLREGWLDPGDTVITMDADGQHRPEDVRALAERLEAGPWEVSLGRRDLSNYPLHKRVGNLGLSLLASLLSGQRLRDSECGLRALRAGGVARLLEHYTGHRYSCAMELAVLAGRLGLRIDNSLLIRVPHYRVGRANIWNGLQNAGMGLVALLRVALGWRRELEPDLQRVRQEMAGLV